MSEPAQPANVTEEDPSLRPRRREPVFNLHPAIVGIIVVCVAVHLVRLYVLTADQDFALLVRTAFIPVRYSGKFALDVWAFVSPFTYTFLHGGFAHLGVNMIWLTAFGSPLANRLGLPRFLAFFAVTGVAAAFFFWAIHPLEQSPLIGASGAISGMMAAAARFAFRVERSSGRAAFAGAPLPLGRVLRSRSVLTFLGVWFVINLATGLAGLGLGPGSGDQVAWEAHIGGFLAGFFGLRLFDRPLPEAFDDDTPAAA